MKAYIAFCKQINRIMLLIAVLLLGFATGLTFLQVFTRNILQFSFTWAEETTRYVVIFAVYLASGHIVSIEANASVDMLYGAFSPKVQGILTMVFYTLIAVFLLIMGYYGYQCVLRNLNVWCASVRIPWAIPFSSVLLGSFNMLLQVPVKIYDACQRCALFSKAPQS